MVDVANLRELNFDDFKGQQVPIGISNKHVHVCQEDLETLFGAGYELTNKKDLSQPGQFACEEKVDVVGPKGTIKGVRILGPVRPETQIELAQTDARSIGVNALLRESGKLEGTEGCKLIGPKVKLNWIRALSLPISTSISIPMKLPLWVSRINRCSPLR